MRIPEEVINQIREQVDIVDVVGDYVSLEKRGRNHFACCPFHQEDTPSFSVSEEKQIFYCFGCHEGGNVFNFLMKKEGLSFIESVHKVAALTNIDISKYETVSSNKLDNQLKPYYDINLFIADFYHYVLKTEVAKHANMYLTNRHITQDIIDHFNIGFAPIDQTLGALLQENNYDLQKATELGIIFEGKDLLSYYDAMRNRIVFPILDNFGNHVAFTGRLIEDSDQAPKYYHSQESKVFKKRTILYNYYKAQADIKREKKIIICEGIFEVIALYRAGIKNAVATLGTAVTKEQLDFIKKKNLQVTFIFDNDKAGKAATMKALELAKGQGINAKAVIFWEYAEKDLDELSSHITREQMQQLVGNEIDLIQYGMKYYKERFDFDNNDDRQSYAKKILNLLAGENEATMEFYLDKLMEETNYSMKALENLQQKKISNEAYVHLAGSEQSSNDYYEAFAPPPDTNDTFDSSPVYGSEPSFGHKRNSSQSRTPRFGNNRQLNCEQLIIKGISQGDTYVQIYKANPVLSQNHMFRKIMYELLEMNRTAGSISLSEVYEKLSPEESLFFSTAIYREEPVNETIFKDLLHVLKHEAEERFFIEEAKKADSNLMSKIEQVQNLLDFKRKNNKIKGD